ISVLSVVSLFAGLTGACDEEAMQAFSDEACDGLECGSMEGASDTDDVADSADDVFAENEDGAESSGAGLEDVVEDDAEEPADAPEDVANDHDDVEEEVSNTPVFDGEPGDALGEDGVETDEAFAEVEAPSEDEVADVEVDEAVEDDAVAYEDTIEAAPSVADDVYAEPEEEASDFFAVAAATTSTKSTSGSRQVQRPLGTTTAKQGYYEYLPFGYSTSKKYPLLIFLHGLGENGDGKATQLERVVKNGPPMLIKNNKWSDDRTFVVLSPQHPGGGCPSADEVDKFLTYALSAYSIDTDRVYLTGLSCGAYGVWNYLGKYTDKAVTAAVPIAGNGVSAFNTAGCN